MRYYPQVVPGGLAQYPVSLSTVHRSVVNGDGHYVYADLDADEVRWTLEYGAVTKDEWDKVAALHADVEGRYSTFTFFEPGGNLLRWSEELDRDVWIRDANVLVSEGVSDPLGGDRATTLSGPVGSTLTQTLDAPANFEYVASTWARTTGSGSAISLWDGGAPAIRTYFEADGLWRRYAVMWPGESVLEALSVGIDIGDASLEVYGLQLEAQRAPSAYKATTDLCAVLEGARFADDDLRVQVTGPNEYRGVVRIVWTPLQA